MTLIRDSRVLERTADWVNRTLTLPYDMVVKVTAEVPPGVTDAVTQPDGRTIYIRRRSSPRSRTPSPTS
ncbi:hypothetical protein ACU686_22355 [Yinghuangia aomiensis]